MPFIALWSGTESLNELAPEEQRGEMDWLNWYRGGEVEWRRRRSTPAMISRRHTYCRRLNNRSWTSVTHKRQPFSFAKDDPLRWHGTSRCITKPHSLMMAPVSFSYTGKHLLIFVPKCFVAHMRRPAITAAHFQRQKAA